MAMAFTDKQKGSAGIKLHVEIPVLLCCGVFACVRDKKNLDVLELRNIMEDSTPEGEKALRVLSRPCRMVSDENCSFPNTI